MASEASSQEPVEVYVGADPIGVAVEDELVWVARQDGFVVKIDESTAQALTEFRAARTTAHHFAVTAGGLWFLCERWRISLEHASTTGEVGPPIALGRMPFLSWHGGLAADIGSVWALVSSHGIFRVDALTREVKRLEIDGSPSALAIGPTAVWFIDDASHTVRRISKTPDLNLGPRAPINDLQAGELKLAVVGDHVVVATADGLQAVRAEDARPAWKITLGKRPLAIAAVSNRIAVFCSDGSLAWVTPDSGALVEDDRSFPGVGIAGFTGSRSALWLLDGKRGVVTRVPI
jgi:hypothetical protein